MKLLEQNKREQMNQQKGSLKRLKRIAPEVKVLLKTKCSWSDDVIRSKFIRSISSETEDHQKPKFIRRCKT